MLLLEISCTLSRRCLLAARERQARRAICANGSLPADKASRPTQEFGAGKIDKKTCCAKGFIG